MHNNVNNDANIWIFVHPATSDYFQTQTEDSAWRFTNLLLNKLVVCFLKPWAKQNRIILVAHSAQQRCSCHGRIFCQSEFCHQAAQQRMEASCRGVQEKIYWGVHTKSENRFSLLKLMLLKIKYSFKTRLKKVSRWRFHTPHHISRLLCVGVSTVCVRTPIKETYWCTNSWACWQNDLSQKNCFPVCYYFSFSALYKN